MLVATRNQVAEVVEESFEQDLTDDFWYPMEPGTPLVRIQIADSGYQIQRRRKADSPWMPIVTADTAEFDVDGFRLWRDRWPLVVR